MNSIVVFTQNLKMESLIDIKSAIESEHVIFVTPHYLFENEKKFIRSIINGDCSFLKFADFISDKEMEDIDKKAFKKSKKDMSKFLDSIKYLKNEKIVTSICNNYGIFNGYILSQNNDIGLADEVWLKAGFQKIKVDYYFYEKGYGDKLKKSLSNIKPLKVIYRKIRNRIGYFYKNDEVFVAHHNNKKYIFIGKMHRIGYRMNLIFKESESECKRLNKGQYYRSDECQYLTTLHESGKCQIPDCKSYDVRRIQDGYLPPNYLKEYYSFIPDNVKYYVWDALGAKVFTSANLPVEIMPFRKKLYMPEPVFPSSVKNILVVASGAGDWTALKNRSDDDLLVEAFVKIAKKYPDIHIIYRCHPSWVHPQNLGVNSIRRVFQYFDFLNINNIEISLNTPNAVSEGEFQLSFARSSLEEDLKKADLVFGEHSVSMIDAAFMRIPFCSVNMTNRRNLFIGMTELGFPHCASVEEISNVITQISTENFQKNYKEAVLNYNKMTEEDKV